VEKCLAYTNHIVNLGAAVCVEHASEELFRIVSSVKERKLQGDDDDNDKREREK
jgi:hypothetical protein